MASEFELIAALTAALQPGDAVVGPGDDAAVLAFGSGLHVLTSDILVENVDFRRRYASPRDIGFKAVAVTLSDIAAMGAAPRYLTVDIGSPEGSIELFSELGAGLQEACASHRCSVVGGDISRSPVLLLSTTGIGKLKGRPILRSGALPGDLLLCTGTLGDSAAGLVALDQALVGYPHLCLRHLRPEPRVLAGATLGELGLASAMIDISDGLLQDLGHLCLSSQVSAALWLDDLPLSPEFLRFCSEQHRGSLPLATSGGEDFELLFTAPERHLFELQNALAGLVPIHVIGEIQEGAPSPIQPRVSLFSGGQDVTGQPPWQHRQAGWDHFRPRPRAL